MKQSFARWLGVLGGVAVLFLSLGCGTSVSTTPQGPPPEEVQATPEYVEGEKANK